MFLLIAAPISKPGTTAKTTHSKPKGCFCGSGKIAPVGVVVAVLRCIIGSCFVKVLDCATRRVSLKIAISKKSRFSSSLRNRTQATLEMVKK